MKCISRISSIPVTMMLLACAFASIAQEPAKLNYAVIDIKNADGVTKGESDIIGDRLRTELFRTGRASMMERDQMQEILKEQGFQQSGTCTDDACMVQMGQLLGVQRLISGSIGKLGSMFLVNFRTIDVQTGKIIKVVSVDIKGGIEDVVGELPSIAGQLTDTGTSSSEKTVVVQQTTTTTTEPKKEEPKKEEPKKEPEPVKAAAAPKTETKTVDGDREDKNRNRAGMRLCYSLFFGPGKHAYPVTQESYGQTILDTSYDQYLTGEKYDGGTPLMQYEILFAIKAGPFLTVDIGPAFASQRQNFIATNYDSLFNSYTEELHYRYSILAIHTGLNFGYRIFPIKINAGIFAEFSFPFVSWEYSNPNDSYSDDSGFNAGFTTAFGGHAGIEILAGTHVGFAFDFIIRRCKFKTALDDGSFDDALGTWVNYKIEHETTNPLIGLGFSVNFYF
jgi:hypothetical protein